MPTPYSPYVADDPVQDALIASRAVHNRPRFDFNDRGPAMMERKIAEKMLQDKAQIQAGQRISMPLTTGEMVPSIGTEPTRLEQAVPRAPTQVTLPSNERAARGRPFDTATEGRLRNVPGAYEEAVRNLVPQAPMTAKNETTGESFVAQPAPRMDRRALEQLIARKMLEEQERKGQAQLDAARQHDLSKARIPGESALGLQESKNKGAVELRKLEADLSKETDALKRQEIQARIDSVRQSTQQGAASFEDSRADRARRLEVEGSPEQARADALYERLSEDPIANRAALAALLPRTSFGGVASSDPAIASAITQPNVNPAQSQAIIESNPILKQSLSTLSEFAKKLSGQSTFGVNTLSTQDIATFKNRYDDLINEMTSNGISPENAKAIVKSQLEAILPVEPTPSTFSQIIGDIAGAFNPLRGIVDITSGRPGTPAQDLRSAAGL